ncbi:MAG: PQQ-binding-like beta-propeller repeat protein, partial [bacterium]|nr:PQQ-binding-like beta-propeller repeat protein [bacterium]
MKFSTVALSTMLCLLSSAALVAQTEHPGTEADARPSLATQLNFKGVTTDDLLRADQQPHNWLMYSGQYNGQRYSRLDQINTSNARNLKVQWVRQFPLQSPFETSPLVVDGMMFITLPNSGLVALDAKTGLPFWDTQIAVGDRLALCCGKVNRGVAILGETLFMGTLDAKLVAIDAKSGNERWKAVVGDPTRGESITAAPLVVKDMVITGIAG